MTDTAAVAVSCYATIAIPNTVTIPPTVPASVTTGDATRGPSAAPASSAAPTTGAAPAAATFRQCGPYQRSRRFKGASHLQFSLGQLVP